MELWIRSQDKKRLIKATNIYLDEEIEYVCEKYSIKCGTIEIGYYTWYRALEVLDEIQEAQLANYHYSCPSNVKASNNENTIVYQMPSK